ncbi:M48 family metallopeptidase [Gloeocapsa sp. PCC 73106]|uniref:M48 family metallopeptidase n=1 Tax=Gloeocapsa sp. PCC 73106 TaxID=102232 RepID=UPI0002AC3EB3|nr:M48 family metallopeptidase [Gloeocapsa sp. PCC 73106]ELR97667.1 Peptidase family M48 [Gloeocapsa sp. PCC 73106]
MVKRRKRYLIAIIVTLIITLSYQLPSYGNRWFEILIQGVQILQITQLSDADEVKLGEKINQQLLESGEVKLNRDREINGYLDKMGQRLAQSSDRPNIPYTFLVVNDDSVNAFATMGGFVYIHTGLMVKADNEAELASVVAHEIGHIVGRHALKQMRQQAIAQGVMTATGLDENEAIQIGVEVGLRLPRSREAEKEADQLGLANLKSAGYAPIAMITFMEKLLKLSESGTLTILSTHPATSERIVKLREAIDPVTANQGDGLNSKEYRRQIQSLL